MLTTEAYADRKWGHLPALRKVLEHLPVPDTRDNPMLSTSDSEFERLNRNMEIALTVLENAAVIAEGQAKKEEALVLLQDLERLEHQLMDTSETFRTWARHISEISSNLIRRIHELEPRPPDNP